MAYFERTREIPPLKVGENGIVYVFDTRSGLSPDDPGYKRGYMGVRESGNIDVFWHRWDGLRSVLAHHGGVHGFPDIEVPIRQCRRIIRGYLGIEETIEMEDDLAVDEVKPPVSLREFGDLIGTAQTVFIPGYQDWALSVKAQIDRAVREITSRPGFLNLGGSVQILQNLRQKLDRSRNPLLSELGMDIEEALLANDRFKQLSALRRGGMRIIDRMDQIDSMVLSVMQRHNRLEAHRSNTESNVRRLYFDVMRIQGRFEEPGVDQRKLAASLAANATLYLDSLVSNPYKEKSKKFAGLKEVYDLLETEGPDRVAQVIRTSATLLHGWKDDLDEAEKGRFTDRYPVVS